MSALDMNFNYNDKKMKMKKFYLLVSLFAFTLIMTSCLGEGSRNYSETTVVYIDIDLASGKTYGKTLTGRLITSNEIQLMLPGSFKFFNYSWDEAYGTTLISQSSVDNVVISGDPVDISRTPLSLSEPPVVDEPVTFLAMGEPYYVNNEQYLGDHWLFKYAYETRKGESAHVQFYKVDDSELLENEVLLEIRLVITGTPEEGASLTSKTDIVAVNMGPLRSYFEAMGQSRKDVKIKFQYHQKNRTEVVKMANTYLMTVGGES